jgi:hypothetical protein
LALENYPRQRARRRPGDDGAIGSGIFALVAWAGKQVCLGMVEDGARSVRASAAEGDESVLRRVEQDAGLDVRRIAENFRAADGKLRRLRDHAHRIFRRQRAKDSPRGRGSADERGSDQEFDDFPARCGGIFLNADGESFLLAPLLMR